MIRCYNEGWTNALSVEKGGGEGDSIEISVQDSGGINNAGFFVSALEIASLQY